ncbi:MAG TPA: hypothetical protein VE640_10065 [Candidatus Bathyarchaeia archaeon]|nr:hypothetical protein [Candidatus Bathyarchaeia archaeon]
MRLIPPTRRFCAAAVAAIASAAIAAGCGSMVPASDQLLVATGGPLQVTDRSGSLVAFDGPADPVVAVTASAGHVVVATAGGLLTASDNAGGPPRAWRALAIPTSLGEDVPLMALSPLGSELALAVGDPQAERFDLVILDVASGTSRTIAVRRGLNGPPSWLGESAVAIDVIGPDGNSEIATIDTGRGAITDASVPAGLVSATADGQRVAVDDPSGDVLIGDLATWRNGSLGSMTRVHGPAGAGVESLTISPEGGRLAVARRDDSGVASIELFRELEQGWSSVRTLTVPGDGPVSVAWLR